MPRGGSALLRGGQGDGTSDGVALPVAWPALTTPPPPTRRSTGPHTCCWCGPGACHSVIGSPRVTKITPCRSRRGPVSARVRPSATSAPAQLAPRVPDKLVCGSKSSARHGREGGRARRSPGAARSGGQPCLALLCHTATARSLGSAVACDEARRSDERVRQVPLCPLTCFCNWHADHERASARGWLAPASHHLAGRASASL